MTSGSFTDILKGQGQGQGQGGLPAIFDKKVVQMENPQTWRDLLKQLLRDPHQRERIAHALGVTQTTLLRWVNHVSNPRPQNLQNLLIALPEHRELLLPLVTDEFKDFTLALIKETCEDDVAIPSVFYARLLHTKAHAPKHLLFPLICDQLLEQFLKELDSARLGLAVFVVCCLPPSAGDKVRSLLQRFGRGVSPWEDILDQHVMFTGIESLAGRAITSARIVVSQRLSREDRMDSSCRDERAKEELLALSLHMSE